MVVGSSGLTTPPLGSVFLMAGIEPDLGTVRGNLGCPSGPSTIIYKLMLLFLSKENLKILEKNNNKLYIFKEK